MSLGCGEAEDKPVIDYLRKHVKSGKEPSMGWALERLVLERMKKEKRAKKTKGV